MARPTKLTPETQAKILLAIRAGNYLETACSFAGISYNVFRTWILRGQTEKTGIYHEFMEAVREAEAAIEVQLVGLWRQALPENPAAISDFMGKRWPDRWGRKDTLRIERDRIIEDTRQLAREQGADEEAAVAEVKRYLGVR